MTPGILPDFSNPTPGGLFLSLDGKSHAVKDAASTAKTQGAYVTSFSEAIRAELHGTGVTVTTLCLGPVHTEFTQVAVRRGAKRDQSPEFVNISAEEVAHVGLAARRMGKFPLHSYVFLETMRLANVSRSPIYAVRCFPSRL